MEDQLKQRSLSFLSNAPKPKPVETKHPNEKHEKKSCQQAIDSFQSWLRSKQTYQKDNSTHTCLHPLMGKFQLGYNEFDSFWDRYGELIRTFDRESEPVRHGLEDSWVGPLGLTEKPQEYTQVVVDIDIKVSLQRRTFDPEENLYTIQQLKTVVEIYQTVLNNLLKDPSKEKLVCLALEKPPYVDGKDIKNGFHLQFPNIFISQKDINVFLIPKVKTQLKESNIFGLLGIPDSSTVIDNVCHSTWLLYGSSKKDGACAYKVTKAFGYDPSLMKCTAMTVPDALDLCRVYDGKEREIFRKSTNEPDYFFLPKVLSILPRGRKVSHLKENLPCRDMKKLLPTSKNVMNTNKTRVEVPFGKAIKEMRDLVGLFSLDRATEYKSWIDVGIVLFNVGKGTKDALDIWIEFSRRCSDKFDEAECCHLWNKFEPGEYTMGTLVYYAKQDNPDGYQKYKEKQSRDFIENLASYQYDISHFDIAEFMYKEYGNLYVCSDIRSNEWFIYESHAWHRCEEGYSLHLQIPRLLTKKFTAIKRQIQKELSDTHSKKKRSAEESEDSNSESDEDGQDDVEEESKEEQDDKKKKLKQIENLGKLCKQVKMTPFVSSVMKFCKLLFYKPRFMKLLNSKRHLFGVKNGVLDAKEGIWRPGRPEDYISTQGGFSYEELSYDHPDVLQLNSFMEQLFPNPNIREYFMDRQCQIFMGGNLQKVIELWSGGTNAGKSTVVQLMKLLLDRYGLKLPTSFATGDRTSSSAPTPEIAQIGEGARKTFLQEPNANKKLNVGALKELSGNDSMYARYLNKNGGEMEVMTDLVIICNNIPKLSALDSAIATRLKNIPFEAYFTENAPSTKEEQMLKKTFPVDRSFDSRLPEMVVAFAWVLFQRWNKIKNKLNTLVEPTEVREATDSYIDENDFFARFFRSHTVKTGSRDDKLDVSLLYNSFKDWIKDSFPGVSLCDKYEFKKQMNQLFGHEAKTHWVGYKETKEDKNQQEEVHHERFLLSERDRRAGTVPASGTNPSDLL